MKPVPHSENLHAALWKSTATEVIAKQLGVEGEAGGIGVEHPILAGVAEHVRLLEAGRPVPRPGPGRTDESDPDVAAYLSELHHRIAHARLASDPKLEAQLQAQLSDFRYGAPPWQQMAIQYYEYYAQYPYHLAGVPRYRSWQAADGGAGDPQYGVIRWTLPADGRVAIDGDIGTGTDVAAATLTAALSFAPDAILHLGDVYYSGTGFEFEHRFTGLFESVFRGLGARVPVFTVPGNHEYFTGAIALLDCLDSGALVLEEGQRQQASYFSLRSEDEGWQFLGMDTGYHGHTMSVPPAQQQAALAILNRRDASVPLGTPAGAPGAAAAGTAGLPVAAPAAEAGMVRLRDDEAGWHAHHAAGFAGRSILLSHHQLYSATAQIGTAQRHAPGGGTAADPSDLSRPWVDTDLWRQLGPLFGTHVAAWFWGHEHNLGIFQDGYLPADWPADLGAAADAFRALPKGRCCGHAAIPVNVTEKPYATTYPVPLKEPTLTLGLTDGWYNRGFEILDLAGAGNPARVRYFQIAGVDPTPLLIHEETVT
jgi:hypothetical protein